LVSETAIRYFLRASNYWRERYWYELRSRM